jgi:hypothetical protein
MNKSLFNIELTYIFDFYDTIKYSLDDIDQKMDNLNLIGNNEGNKTIFFAK